MTSQEQISAAEYFATSAHSGQERKFSGAPYIIHPCRVAEAAMIHSLSTAAVMAAWLHDVVEDCDVPIDAISTTFGTRVGRMVWGLTNCEARIGAKDLGWNRAKRKMHDAAFLSVQNAETRMLKLLDLADNLSDWPAEDSFLDLFLVEAAHLGAELIRDDGIKAAVHSGFLAVYTEAENRRENYVEIGK